MSINFFENKCKSTTNNSQFGLCDEENNSPAYINFTNRSKWNAIVNNSLPPKEVVFVAIDHCIDIRRENGDMDNRCDCFLTYPDNIIFVELKNKGSDWIQDGIKQIEATLIGFSENHDLSVYKHKRAFVANKKHPDFHIIKSEEKRKFWDKYRVRLNIHAEININ